MAKGDRVKWTTRGREIKKFDRTPIKSQDWDGKFLGTQVEVATSDQPGSMPYIKTRIVAMGSGADGASDKMFFHNIFVSLRPNDAGDLMLDNEGQLSQLAQAFGQDYEPGEDGVKHGKFRRIANKGKENETVEEFDTDYLDPHKLAEWLKQFDGQIVRLHSRIQKGNAEYLDPKSVIERFYPADAGTSEPGDDVIEDGEVEEEVVEEEEEAPAPPVRKTAPAAKGKAAPQKRR